MKTVGDLIRETRLKKNLSREELGELTHIKKNFIKGVEESDWNSLPEISVVVGFVKSISHFLDIDENLAVALLKREYKFPKPVSLGSKSKEIGKKFIWGPRMTFLAGVIIVILIVLGYLGIQYQRFNSPPSLSLESPKENQLVGNKKVKIIGKTDPDATVEVNNQPILVEGDGNFTAELEVTEETQKITVKAKSRSGKTTSISRTIKVEAK